ncbi:hypothetical protein [Bordetella petrii]|uniref:hypothetical protein n=1 Tax=Bordetella petrii TaxID=94624 RepID=UPI001E60F3B7|nr:hypothetical protein [Bordetella petrii]MCD0504132.1 hypothetical protein [Bordetella petrii]
MLAGSAWTRADHELLDQINRWLAEPSSQPLQHQALRRFQQLTPPLAAKAVEDTLFYRHGPLLSRNEVGTAPGQFALPTAEFHAACAARARRFPAAMLATATHDHKRGEDVRARLAVLSEIPLEWLRQVQQWLGTPGKPPTAGDRSMLMQTLVGAWPLGLQPSDGAGVAAFVERVRAWQQKAMREAKLHSSWEEPDTAYEAAGEAYLESLASGPTLPQIAAFAMYIAPAGLLNSLAQATLRMTVPGVPDLYQGTEFWDFSLVDPDNRQSVDYPARHAALARLAPPDQPAAITPLSSGGPLAPQWTAGHVKQHVVQRLLQLRASHPLLFDHGSYLPVSVHGLRAAHVLAFVRNHEDQHVLVLAPRLCAMQLAGHSAQQASAFWADTRLRLPAGMARLPWRDIFTHDVQRPDTHGCLDVARLLENGPVSVRLA